MDLHFLTSIARNLRHPDPDGAAAIGRIPLFYLKCQRPARRRGEAEIRTLGRGLIEVEELTIQSQQDGEIPYD